MSTLSALPEGFRELRAPGGRSWILREGIPLEFELKRWDAWLAGEEGTVLTREGGRSPSRRLNLPGIGEAVVRRYLHGGALAVITQDLFMGDSRPRQELEASERIRQRGLATPEILAVYSREFTLGLRRACLLSRLVPDGENLRQWLRHNNIGSSLWFPMLTDVARAISAMHTAGCFHMDLNVSNLFADSNRIWILDLDGARLGNALGIADRGKNLLRLHRSLCRESGMREPLSHREGVVFLKIYAGGDSHLYRELAAWLRSHWAGHLRRMALAGMWLRGRR